MLSPPYMDLLNTEIDIISLPKFHFLFRKLWYTEAKVKWKDLKIMKRIIAIMLTFALMLAGCSAGGAEDTLQTGATQAALPAGDIVYINLSDDGITVDYPEGAVSGAVTTDESIIYYEEGHDFTYGEGTVADEHSASEAAAHTVVTITQPGTYSLSGKLSAGQVAVDLGDEAAEDPNAVVTLILDGVDITCTVAPAVIFYNVYECGDKDTASQSVDTTAAGANVYIADGTYNTVNGSYVARIYKPDSVVLTEDGTAVDDAKKLHKYDGAFYSKMSMNITGNDGILNINAENEGLDTELHLTINGGNINIVSGNDGINTNEDGISVTTVNGGSLTITVNGATGEGDGIDSNGWLVINGGTVTAAACSFSGDAGIDSDMGIHINGGTVLASGNMLDTIAGGEQTYAVFTFSGSQAGGSSYTLKSADGNPVLSHTPANDLTCLIIAADALAPGEYTFWRDDIQLSGAAGMGFGGGMRPGGQQPEGMQFPEGQQPEGMQFPEGQQPPEIPEDGQRPEMPEGMQIPQGGQPPEMPEGGQWPEMPENATFPDGEAPEGRDGFGFGGGRGGNRGQMGAAGESSTIFTIAQGANYFSMVTEAQQ